MKILILSFDPVTEVGGVEGRVRGYVRILAESGHRIHVLDLSRSTYRRETTMFGAGVEFLSPSLRRLLSSLSTISRRIMSITPNAIFVLSGSDAALGVLLLAYARVKGIKSAAFLYGKDILSAKRNLLRFLMLLLGLSFAKKLAANSRATARLLPVSLQHNISILYPGVDPGIRFDLDIEKTCKTILFVGRLVARKGVDDLITAFSQVLKEVPDATLEIVGGGPEKSKLEKLAISLGVEDSIQFFGTLLGKELYRRYAECVVFCMPSKRLMDDVEGFGTVFLEAGLFGKPSVSTWSGGISEAIVDGQTGILVREGDVAGLRDALVKLLGDRELSIRLGEKARSRVLSEFTTKKATDRLLSLFS